MRGTLEDRLRERSRRDRWRSLGLADWALLAEALFLVTVAAMVVALLPFARIGQLASRPAKPAGRPLEPALAQRIRWAVEAVARRMPFRAKCFENGLAAQWMLRRRGYASTLFYGATMKAAVPLAAHVWVRVGDLDIVGCDNAADFTVLARFPEHPA